MKSSLDAAEARRRFLILVGLRWLPTGLALPVTVLLMLDRGLSLADVGVVTAMQGVMVVVLELPTGGLADVIGRRCVLLTASLFAMATYSIVALTSSPTLFALAWALQGVYRALESGPLDSWYVDIAQADDPGVDIESTLSQGVVVLGLSIAVGGLLATLLVALVPMTAVNPLAFPILVALGLQVVQMFAVARLVQEPAQMARPRFRSTSRRVPIVVRQAIQTVRGSPTLIALAAAETLWGFGIPAFEIFTPAKLGVVSGSTGRAAQLFGPIQIVGWIVSAAGAAAVPWIARRVGVAGTASIMLSTQALFVILLALSTGPTGVAVAFVLIMSAHGGANAAHSGLLHRAVTSADTRSSVVSLNSLCAMSGATIGGITLGLLADATTMTSAIVVAAMVIGIASPLYLFARADWTFDSKADDYS